MTKAGQYRRFDLVFCSWLERPFALFGWTGSALFNRTIRLHAMENKAVFFWGGASCGGEVR